MSPSVYEQASAAAAQVTGDVKAGDKKQAEPDLQSRLDKLAKRFDSVKQQRDNFEKQLNRFNEEKRERGRKQVKLTFEPSLALQTTLRENGIDYKSNPVLIGVDEKFNKLKKLIFPLVTIANALIRDPVNTQKLFDRNKVYQDKQGKEQKRDENNSLLFKPNVFDQAIHIINTLVSNDKIAGLIDDLDKALEEIKIPPLTTISQETIDKQEKSIRESLRRPKEDGPAETPPINRQTGPRA